MTDEAGLFLISANKSRPPGVQWSDDDYDVRVGSLEGPVIGRMFRSTQAPAAEPWFWTITEPPSSAADHGYAETREEAN